MAPRTVCVLVSGGFDSLALLVRCLRQGRQVAPVYVRCGLRWERAELYWLRRQLRALRQPRLQALRIARLPLGSLYGDHWSLTGRRVPSRQSRDQAVYLPGRNLLLLSVAGIVCAEASTGTIMLGTLRSNPFGDASPAFFRQMSRCLTLALGRPIKVTAPLIRKTKAQVMASVPGIPVRLAFSCLNPRGVRPCRRCNKCAEAARLLSR